MPAAIITPMPDLLPRLRVSENRRFLVTEGGNPFFWLGDTAWELFHRLNRDETRHYLRHRATQGFTVVQAVILAELDGLGIPNREGHTPLVDNDPTRPNEAYFDHIDWVLTEAAAQGIYIALVPTWGDKWNRGKGIGPEIFSPENAALFGEWVGRRFRGRNVVWLLGGDRLVETDRHKTIIEAMARGLRAGDQGHALMTFHPYGGRSSAEWFHDEDWLDFNMRQNGHGIQFAQGYTLTRRDYDRTPTKPVIDGEPAYEDHAISFNAAELGHATATDVRRLLYWNLFSGAFGHTYGHHSVWQMAGPAWKPVNAPLMTWREALDQAGARQMQYGRRLMESRPFLSRIPDDDLIVPGEAPTAMPGAGRYRFVATRDLHGSYAMIYAPVERKFRVRMNAIAGTQVIAWWFNPRNGRATSAGEYSNRGEAEFTPPSDGEGLDWVLVLDDVARGFPPPGAR